MVALMASGTLSSDLLEAQQAYINGSFLEAHSLFLDLMHEASQRGFSLLKCLCRAYLLLTEEKTGGKPERIKHHLDTLKELIEDLGDALESEEVAKVFIFLSSELLHMKKYFEAAILLKTALKIAKSTKHLENLKSSTYYLAYAYLGIQKPVEAAKLLGIAANLEEDFLEAEQGIKQALEIYGKIKALDHAFSLSQDFLNKWKDNETAIQKIHSLKAELGKNCIAQVAKTENAERVRSYIGETLESCKQAGDGKLLCETLYQAGVALDALEEPERENFWKKAREISLRFSSPDVFIRSSVSLAFILIDAKKPTEAKPLLEDALEIAQDLGNQVMVERTKAILSSVETIMPTPEEDMPLQDDISPSVDEEELFASSLLDINHTAEEMELREETVEDNGSLPGLPTIPTTESGFERIDLESQEERPVSEAPTILSAEPESVDEDVEVLEITRETIGNFLASKGYSVKYDQQVDGTTVIDIVATKKKRGRRKNLFVLFSETPGDAKIGSFLLNRLRKSGKKIIYLTSGSSMDVGRVGEEIQLATDLFELDYAVNFED
jgi:tetratricopeptide (TPR) repeat protein